MPGPVLSWLWGTWCLPSRGSWSGRWSEPGTVVAPCWACRDERRSQSPLPCRRVGWGVACGVNKLWQVLLSFKLCLLICKAGVNNSSHPMRLLRVASEEVHGKSQHSCSASSVSRDTPMAGRTPLGKAALVCLSIPQLSTSQHLSGQAYFRCGVAHRPNGCSVLSGASREPVEMLISPELRFSEGYCWLNINLGSGTQNTRPRPLLPGPWSHGEETGVKLQGASLCRADGVTPGPCPQQGWEVWSSGSDSVRGWRRGLKLRSQTAVANSDVYSHNSSTATATHSLGIIPTVPVLDVEAETSESFPLAGDHAVGRWHGQDSDAVHVESKPPHSTPL